MKKIKEEIRWRQGQFSAPCRCEHGFEVTKMGFYAGNRQSYGNCSNFKTRNKNGSRRIFAG